MPLASQRVPHDVMLGARHADLRVGALVRWTGSKLIRGMAPDQLFIVIKDSFDVVNIVQLGGSPGGQYWRVDPRRLEVIAPGDVTVNTA